MAVNALGLWGYLSAEWILVNSKKVYSRLFLLFRYFLETSDKIAVITKIRTSKQLVLPAMNFGPNEGDAAA